IEILKTHIYWAYNQIISGIPNVFNQIPFDDHFTLNDEQKGNEQKIVNGQELKTWMEDFYEHKNGYIISYNKVIPVYNLFENKVKQNIQRFLGKFVEKSSGFIPHMVGFDEKDLNACKDLNAWVSNLPKIHLCDWVKNLHLRHGLTIQSCKIGHGFEVAIDFIDIPDVRSLSTSYMHLRQPSSKMEAFALTNRIKLDIDTKIPFFSTKTTGDNLHPLFDNQQITEIHCLIVSEKVKLMIDVDKVKPSEDLTNAVNEAIENEFPLQSLKNGFEKFGHLWPQIIILGWSLSKVYNHIDSNDKPISDKKFFLNTDDEIILQDQILGIFNDWSKLTKDLNVSFLDHTGTFVEKENIYLLLAKHLDRSFLNPNDEIVKKYEDIYFLRRNLNKDQNWGILRLENLVPLYKVLPEAIQNIIEDIISDRYQILMTGATKINRENQTYVNIQFAQPLQDTNYEMFGQMIDNNNLNRLDVMIRFNLATQYGCRAIIHKPENLRIPVSAKIFWIILGKGHGFFSRHTRDIKILYGKELLSGQFPITCNVSISNDKLPDSFVFVTSFDSDDLNKNQVIQANTDDGLKSNLSLNISQSNAEAIQSIDLNNFTMRWCLINTNQKDFAITDVGMESFNWSILGEVVTVEPEERICVNVKRNEKISKVIPNLNQKVSEATFPTPKQSIKSQINMNLTTGEIHDLYKTKIPEKSLVDYSELEDDLKSIGAKSFNYSQFSEIKKIGSGGSAVVYSAIFQEKKYALKSLNNNLSSDYKRFKQIMRELKNLYKTSHPNIIELFGISI
ncbi:34333_t:CDS:2, partial [Racocetra persica]